jgi:hypothetical protein
MTRWLGDDLVAQPGPRLEFYKVMEVSARVLTIGLPNDGGGTTNWAPEMDRYKKGELRYTGVRYLASYAAPVVGDLVAVLVTDRMGMLVLGKVAG